MVPNPKFLDQVRRTLVDPSAPLLVGCSSGKRSCDAIQQMRPAGYKTLVNVKEGFQGWKAKQLPVEA